MKDGEVNSLQVEVGSSNDSQTEIISGINEGDEIITSIIASGKNTTENSTASPFGGMGGSGTIRMIERPRGGF